MSNTNSNSAKNKDYNKKEDILGHQKYVDDLCNIIKKFKKGEDKFKGESYVIGLEGEWGIGKTWILDRLRGELENSKSNLINLDPWTSFGYKYFIKDFYISLRDKTLNWFFRSLNFSFKQAIKELSESDLKIGNIYKLVPLIYIGIITPGGFLFFDKFNWDFIIFIAVSTIIYLLVLVIVTYFNQEKSYTKIKEEIKKKVTNKFAKNPLVVIIDDLDRADSEDIRQVFKLIKSDANFEHIIYILSYDRNNIGSKIGNNESSFFFDKIVQHPIRVKDLDKQDLREYFVTEINSILDKYSNYYPKQKDEQDKYLLNIIFGYSFNHEGLFKLISNLRMLKKFLVVFENALENRKEYLDFDICLGDLAVIEFLRIYDPKVYKDIKNNTYNYISTDSVDVNVNELDKTGSNFKNQRGRILADLLNFSFKKAVNNYKIGGKIIPGKEEVILTYFNSQILGDSEKTNNTEISNLLEESELSKDVLKGFLEIKQNNVRHFCAQLTTYAQNSDVLKFVIPLIELGDTYNHGSNHKLCNEELAIKNFLDTYYQNEKPNVSFSKLVDSESIFMLSYFLASYKKKFENTDVTHQYKISDGMWAKLGNIIHEKFKEKWKNHILEFDNFKFVSTIHSWRDLVFEERYTEIKDLIKIEFNINKTTCKEEGKNRFVRMLNKFSLNGGIYTDEGVFVRNSKFPYGSYNNLKCYINLEEIKDFIEFNRLNDHYPICKDFIEGWGNRDKDPFSFGWV